MTISAAEVVALTLDGSGGEEGIALGSSLIRHRLLAGGVRQQDVEEMMRAYTFTLRIRHEMHQQTGRPSDLLTLGVQQQIAESLGYRDTEQQQATELLMHDYYLGSRRLHFLTAHVMLIGPAAVAHGADVDEADLERVLRADGQAEGGGGGRGCAGGEKGASFHGCLPLVVGAAAVRRRRGKVCRASRAHRGHRVRLRARRA